MPHQCVRCSTFYPDGANEIIKGCNCGARLFFFVRQQKIDEAKKATANLTEEDKIEIEKEVFDIMDGLEDSEHEPVVLDFESIRILEPGKYELDLANLFKKEPTIYSGGEGKYMIDLKEVFSQCSPNNKKR